MTNEWPNEAAVLLKNENTSPKAGEGNKYEIQDADEEDWKNAAQTAVVAVIHSSSLLVEAVSSMREWKDETQEETNVTCSGRLNLKKDPWEPRPKVTETVNCAGLGETVTLTHTAAGERLSELSNCSPGLQHPPVTTHMASACVIKATSESLLL